MLKNLYVGNKTLPCLVVEGDDSTVEEKYDAFESSGKINKTYWENQANPRILSSNGLYFKYLYTGGNGRKYKIISQHITERAKDLSSCINVEGNNLIFYTYLFPERRAFTIEEFKFSSFVSIMINKNPEQLVQLQRYDIKGSPHLNVYGNKNFSILAKDQQELDLYNYYFTDDARTPHFHFHNVASYDKFAINLDNLIAYLTDLKSEKNPNLLKYSLNMPFLKIKQNKNKDNDTEKLLKAIYNSLLNIAVETKDQKDINCVKEIREKLHQINPVHLLVNDLDCVLIKLFILKILYGADSGGISEMLSKKLIEIQLKLSSQLTNNSGLAITMIKDNDVDNDVDNDAHNDIDVHL